MKQGLFCLYANSSGAAIVSILKLTAEPIFIN
jgi:hypothetical protein